MIVSLKSCRRQSSLLLVFATTCFILLRNLQSKDRAPEPRSPRMTLLTEEFALPANDTIIDENAELQITGYWKDVRASLGLPLLRDAIVLPDGLGLRTGDSDTERSAVSGYIDERSLRRLGRLNPGLRRRSIDHDPGSPSMTIQSRFGDARMNAEYSTPFRKPSSERNRDYHDFAQSDMPETSDSSLARITSGYPDLFISSEEPSEPRTPASALAASFRAIAVKELKARRGSRHSKRRDRLFR